MKYKKGLAKRLMALFLACVMIISLGNGFSMQAAAQMPQLETSQPEQTDAMEQTGAAVTEAQAETTAPETSSESTGGASNVLGIESSAETQASAETETETESEETAFMSLDDTSSSFVIEGSVNTVQNLSASVLSGESFDYIIGYTVPPIQDGDSYSAAAIQIELPEHLSVVPDADNFNQLSVNGQDVKSSYMLERTLVIKLDQSLMTGEPKTVTIKFQTDNFKWKNGSEITLNPVLTGNKSGGASVTGKLAENAKPVVTVTTDDGWMIDKTVGSVSSDDAYYYAPYTVKVINTKSGTAADEDRLGRLDVAGMQVIDMLPLAYAGSINADGQHIGYAVNGAQAEIIDVKMGETALTNGTDYTVSGDNGQIVFKRTAVSAADGKYTKAGTPISATYTYTVKYPKAAYITPSNESKAEEYWLQNTAILKYTLLGQNEATDKDTAEIVLGEKEKSDGTVESIAAGQEPVFDKANLYDDEKGNVSIIKQVKWQGMDTPAKDVEFALYAVSGRGQAHDENSTAAATLKTDGQGNAKSKPLDAGWYELVETKVPEGYAKALSYWVEIKNNEESTTLYNENGDALGNTIVNEADKGKFILYKYDGDESTNQSSLTQLDQAQFTIERKVSDAPEKWEYTVNNDRNQSIITVLDDTNQPGNYHYESGYLEPGTYRITEITTPEYSYDNGGTQQTITFALNGSAQEFEITKGETLNVNAYNSPQGSITLTKYGQYDPDHVDALKTLSGATFKLYKDGACTREIENSLRTADGNGVCRWENLDPGTYYIKETADGKTAVNNAGFEISTEVQSAVIESGALAVRIASADASISDPEKAKIYKDVTFVNQSNAGKIRIVKTNADGAQKLSGAEFKIFAQEGTGWSAVPLQTLTITDATNGVVSDFLKAEITGTKYKIVETHAPEGYTLDGEMVELEQIVTVYPYHEP